MQPTQAKTQNQIRSEATRARILAAAKAQFVANGLEGTRMEAIATEAGVNKSLVYRHFTDRETLFRHVLQLAYEHLRSAEAALELPNDPLEALDRIASFTLRYYIENPEFLMLVGIENIVKGRHLRESNREDMLVPSLIKILAQVIAQGEASGTFRHGLDPADLFNVICSQCWFTVVTQHTFGFTFEMDVLSPQNVAHREMLIRDNVRRWVLRYPDDVPMSEITNLRS